MSQNKPVTPRLVYFDAYPSDMPESIEEMLPLAPLVVSGLVDAAFPGRLANPKDPNSVVESDRVFLVSSVIKGTALDSQKSFKRVIVSQLGGVYDGKLFVPSGESTLEQGENYILFLQPETRIGLPNIAGLPRYLVVGLWSGKFRVDKIGGVQVSRKAALLLKSHNSEAPDAFINEIRAAIAKNPALGQ